MSILSKLKRLALSGLDIQQMAKWPSALIEDYLLIGFDTATIAKELDQIKNITRVTAEYDILFSDGTIFGNTDAGAFDLNLPAGTQNEYHKISNTGTSANDITVKPDGLELVRGGATLTISDGESAILQYDEDDGWN